MQSDHAAPRPEIRTDLWDLIDKVPAGVVVHDADSAVIAVNLVAAELLGGDAAALRGRHAHHPEWRFVRDDGSIMPVQEFPVTRVLTERAPVKNIVLGIVKADPPVTWVMCNGYPIRSPDGVPDQAVVTFTDITELKAARDALQESEERLTLVLQGSNDASWDVDLTTGSIHFSRRWWEMLGLPVDTDPEHMHAWQSLLAAEDVGPTRKALENAYAGRASAFEIEFRLLHRDGHYVPILSRGFIVRGEDGRALRVAGTNTDLTDRKRAEARIHQLAFYDPLTNLPNRRLLIDQLRRAMDAGERTRRHGALLFIDLDHFKVLNDTQGHETGDRLLQQVGRRLSQMIREGETVARLGGDEFVVLLTDLSVDLNAAAQAVESTGERILDVLSAPYDLGTGVSYYGTPSIGVALFKDASESIETLLKQADLAMYQAKSMGRHTLRFFNVAMQAAVDERVALEFDLRNALHRDELLLHFQPQIGPGGRIVGAEALIRWNHPTRGMLFPASFIPLAETSGLIVLLGSWVLRSACAHLVRWAKNPSFQHITLSINVSAHQLREKHFVEFMRNLLDTSGANPKRLKLELTESVLAEDIEDIIAKMSALKNLGVLFALDDFGTGYSSLSYLRRLPLDQLKIDQSFVRELMSNEKDKAIALIIIQLGVTLSLEVVAEGIETESQFRFLDRCGCQIFQGFFFGVPEKVDAFEASVERWPNRLRLSPAEVLGRS